MKKLYIVYVHITPDGMHYYGVTCQKAERRWRGNGRYYKGTSLQPYIEKYGWNNIQHIVLFENLSKEDALKIEDSLITTAQEDGVCINQRRSGYVSKEEGYQQQISKHNYEQNREKRLEQEKQYREQNKDKIRELKKQYREQNKDKIKEYQQEYREQNKDKIKEQSKQYYEQNKDKIKQYYEDNKDKIKQYREQNREKRLEYQRQYYQRKKLEKQQKEVETTLF